MLVVPVADTSITSFADLSGKKAAQPLTSNWYTLAQTVPRSSPPRCGRTPALMHGTSAFDRNCQT